MRFERAEIRRVTPRCYKEFGYVHLTYDDVLTDGHTFARFRSTTQGKVPASRPVRRDGKPSGPWTFTVGHRLATVEESRGE